MKVGIFFGGRSREREVSFAGGRTVYDVLDKSLFEPVPIFIDSLGNFILLDWHFLYKGSIRDFYPPVKALPESRHNFQIYMESLSGLSSSERDKIISEAGKKLTLEELPGLIDFAFLALHGPYGEDGSIQGILDYLDIPYSGAGVFSSSVGINKAIQKKLFEASGFNSLKYTIISKEEWQNGDPRKILARVKDKVRFPLVVKSASQGSSIGVTILKEENFPEFQEAVNRSFFIGEVRPEFWSGLSEEEEVEYVRELTDLQSGIGVPLKINDRICYHPEEVLTALRDVLKDDPHLMNKPVLLESLQSEPFVVIEDFIEGKEFSCIVIRNDDGKPLALPPTEIRKASVMFDYRAKYLPGISNKVTPIDIPRKQIDRIRKDCEDLFEYFDFNVYARIDGFITPEGKIFLNDPNTTSGMMPSSFFFHQAAEIGLSPGQFITYIIRTSLWERKRNSYLPGKSAKLLEDLDQAILSTLKEKKEKLKVGVFLGGYSSERHISVESGRNVYEKISSSEHFESIPVFLARVNGKTRFYRIPINILLKDNADDIREKILNFKISPVIQDIIEKAGNLTKKYASSDYDFFPRELKLKELPDNMGFAFLALHGRPGEDGTLQKEFEKLGLPYNGSGPESASLTIDKFRTNNLLRDEGFKVANNYLVTKENWFENREAEIERIKKNIGFPVIAKPSDDGCSSAVKKINNDSELAHFAEMMFRDSEDVNSDLLLALKIKPREEIPQKDFFVVESLIGKDGADHFLEITGGMMTFYDEKGKLKYEVFEPSEALAEEGILSLEEKFLAGQGQNITPARFSPDPKINRSISKKVRDELLKVAKVAGVEGYCRIDAFLRIFRDRDPEIIIIEINSLPGLTPATAIFHQAALNGYKPVEFLEKLISFGIQKMHKA